MLLEKIAGKNKIVITGVPRAGKTILSQRLSKLLKFPVLHTDDFLHLPYAELPAAIMQSSEEYNYYIIEGCQAARALVHGLKPDVVIVMTKPFVKLTKKQEAFGKQMLKCVLSYEGDTVFADEL